MFSCDLCNRSYQTKASLRRHRLVKKGKCKPIRAPGRDYPCESCGKIFSRRYNLERHSEVAHREDGLKVFTCGLCSFFAHAREEMQAHRESRHRNRSKFILLKSAHQSVCEQYRLYLPKRYTSNFASCIDYCVGKSHSLISYLLPKRRVIKVAVVLGLRFTQPQFRSAANDEGAEPIGAEEQDVMTHNIRPFARKFMFGNAAHNRRQLLELFEDVANRCSC